MLRCKNGFFMFESLCAGVVGSCGLAFVFFTLSSLIAEHERFKKYRIAREEQRLLVIQPFLRDTLVKHN